MYYKVKSFILDILSPGNRAKILFSRTFLCIIIIFLGLLAYFFLSSIQSTPKKDKLESYDTLIVKPVEKKDHRALVTGYGTVSPDNVIRISAELNGKVVYVRPKLREGVLVERGEVLAKIEKTDYKITLKQAKAELDNLKAEKRILKQDIKNKKLILETIKSRMVLEKKNYKRQRNLYNRNAVSEQIFEQSKQKYQERKNAYLTMKNEISKGKVRLKSKEAKINKALAKKEQAEENLEDCVIKAPISGRIVRTVDLDEDEYVTQGKELFSIANDESLLISVPISIKNAMYILAFHPDKAKEYSNWFKYNNKNISITIKWSQSPHKCIWKGKISRVEKFDTETRTVNIVVDPKKFIGRKQNFTPIIDGMFCEVVFKGKVLKNTIKIPWAALQLDRSVYVVNKNNIVQERDVNIVNTNGDNIIVSSGIKDGEKVVIQRIPQGIVDGSKVKTINYEENVSATGKRKNGKTLNI